MNHLATTLGIPRESAAAAVGITQSFRTTTVVSISDRMYEFWALWHIGNVDFEPRLPKATPSTNDRLGGLERRRPSGLERCLHEAVVAVHLALRVP